MKKTYIIPEAKVYELKVQQQMLAGSGGVTSSNTVGEEYYNEDVSF